MRAVDAREIGVVDGPGNIEPDDFGADRCVEGAHFKRLRRRISAAGFGGKSCSHLEPFIVKAGPLEGPWRVGRDRLSSIRASRLLSIKADCLDRSRAYGNDRSDGSLWARRQLSLKLDARRPMAINNSPARDVQLRLLKKFSQRT